MILDSEETYSAASQGQLPEQGSVHAEQWGTLSQLNARRESGAGWFERIGGQSQNISNSNPWQNASPHPYLLAQSNSGGSYSEVVMGPDIFHSFSPHHVYNNAGTQDKSNAPPMSLPFSQQQRFTDSEPFHYTSGIQRTGFIGENNW